MILQHENAIFYTSKEENALFKPKNPSRFVELFSDKKPTGLGTFL